MSDNQILAKHNTFVLTDDPTAYVPGGGPGGATVIPCADDFGNSLGFDTAPREINIIDMSGAAPMMAGVVDMSKVTKAGSRMAHKQSNGNVLEAFSNLANQQRSLNDYAAPVKQQNAVPSAKAVPVAPPSAAQVLFDDVGNTSDNVLSLLGLDFLATVPTKPRCRVLFDLGIAGHMSAYYHAVVQRGYCLALVFDSRYEGTQYLPPSLDQPIRVTVNSGEAYVAHCRDLSFTLGCMDIIVLIVEEPEADLVKELAETM